MESESSDKGHGHGHERKADATFFNTMPGDDDFCRAKVLKFRMKGREFHWARVGGCRPSSGGYFEIRVKPGSEFGLIPERPRGVHDIFAEVDDSVPNGTIIKYSLFEVIFVDGKPKERELEDPELEIGV
jgi:hypothetical protein